MRAFLCFSWFFLAFMPGITTARQHGTTALAHSVSQQPENGERHSYLGISLRDLDSDRIATLNLPDDRGVEVSRVRDQSPAEKAGIKAGDILLVYNGENILSVQQLVRLVGETPSGRRVRVQLWRDGKVQAVRLTTAPPPSAITQVGIQGGSPPSAFPAAASIGITNMPTPALVWRNFLLGINCEPIESQLAQYFGVKQGVLVRYVEKDSIGNRIGLQAGDVLTAIDDRSIETPQDLSLGLGSALHTSQNVPITVMREHKKLSLILSAKER